LLIAMRIGSSLFLSLVLHTALLSYPVAFTTGPAELLVPVVIMISGEDAGAGSLAAEKAQPKREVVQSGPERRQSVASRYLRTEQPTVDPQQQPKLEFPAVAVPLAPEVLEAASGPSHDQVVSETSEAGIATLATGARGAAGTASGMATGEKRGLSSGTENVAGSERPGESWVGVRYANNPKPDYPDKARREGREGTVLLKVLVDEEGRSKSLEVNRSSGFEPLDKAALETVRFWRFHPARHGDQRVATWVNVPIVFRLADSRLKAP